MQSLNLSNKKKEKFMLWLLMLIMTLTFLIDIYTAISGDAFEIAEINPIYLMTGNIWIVILLNIGFMLYFFYSLNKKVSLPKIYFLVLIIIFLSFGHMFGAYSNIKANRIYNENPEQFKSYRAEVTTQQSMWSYFKVIAIIMIIPAVISLLSFIISYKIFEWRQSKRDKIIEDICELTRKLEE